MPYSLLHDTSTKDRMLKISGLRVAITPVNMFRGLLLLFGAQGSPWRGYFSFYISDFCRYSRGQVVTTSEQSTVESHTRAFHAHSSYQAAGLEQQSDQSTCEIQPSVSRRQSAFKSKQWQARRTRFQQPRRRTWTTANQFPKPRRGFRTRRPESRTGGERATRTVV